jgi:hypothetical protein
VHAECGVVRFDDRVGHLESTCLIIAVQCIIMDHVQIFVHLLQETFGLGTTENVVIIRSGYSSRILLINNVPIPEPVPPPSECASWKPYNYAGKQRFISIYLTCRQSQLSASLRAQSRT